MTSTDTKEIPNKHTNLEDDFKIKSTEIDLEIDSSNDKNEYKMREYKGKTVLIELAGGAILGGLAIVFAVAVNPYMPTITPGLGIKIFDLIAIPMIFAYLIFGIKSGLLATIIGCLGILILPEPMSWLGMIAKFSATLPMIIVPWLLFKFNSLNKTKYRLIPILEETTENLRKNYAMFMITAIIIRLLLMFILNLFVFIPLFSSGYLTLAIDPQKALLFATAYALWNIVQGAGDAYIPFLLAYPTRLAKMFSTW